MSKYFKNIDVFNKYTSFWANESLDLVVFTESVNIMHNNTMNLLNKDERNYKVFLNQEEFNCISYNNCFVTTSEFKPVFSRESYVAPFSFFSAKGFLVFSRQEMDYISFLFENKKYNSDLYSAINFLAQYGEVLPNNNLKKTDKLYLWINTRPYYFAYDSFYGFKELSLTNYKINISFLKEIGPDFYLNLRNYENELDLPLFRYFFNRYQYLITYALPKTQPGLSETALEMKHLYIPQNFINLSFDELDIGKVPYKSASHKNIRVFLDIYGNLIYILK